MQPNGSRRCRATLHALWGAALCVAARAEEPLYVGVRSVVDPAGAKLLAQPLKIIPKGERPGTGKKFAFYPSIEAKSLEPMARPFNANEAMAMLALIQEKLVARGLEGTQPHERPDMVIIVEYGRGFLPNPYKDYQLQANDSQILNGGDPNTEAGQSPFSASAPRTSVTGLPSMSRKEPGHEGKLQAAGQEKLYISVSAYDFFSMQKGQKAKRLWVTIMNVDDPDHRDLNQTFRRMVAAGGDHFARTIGKEELEVPAIERDGRVEIGVPRVVEEPKAAK